METNKPTSVDQSSRASESHGEQAPLSAYEDLTRQLHETRFIVEEIEHPLGRIAIAS